MPTSELVAFAVGLTAGVLIGAGATTIFLIGAGAMVTTRLQAAAPPTPAEVFADQVRRSKAEAAAELVTTLPEPFAGYTTMPIQTIRESLRALSLADREAVRKYEEATQKRKAILSVLTALEEERVNGKP